MSSSHWDDAPDLALAARTEAMHMTEVAEANEAVDAALEAFARQKWYWTLYAKARFALYWATYWVRMQIHFVCILYLGMDAKKSFYRLGL